MIRREHFARLLSGCLALLVVSNTCGSGAISLFGKPKLTYASLAERLIQLTPSRELSDNTKAAASLLESHSDEIKDDLKALVTVFSALVESDDQQTLCSDANLSHLRLITEAMRDQGNHKGADEPLRRLNRLVIGLVVKVRSVCMPYLESKWPAQSLDQWKPAAPSSTSLLGYLQRLDRLTKLFGLNTGKRPSFSDQKLAYLLSDYIMSGVCSQGFLTREKIELAKSHHNATIARQLEEFIYEPCAKLMSLGEVTSVIKPYLDVLTASLIINPISPSMSKFYRNKHERPILTPIEPNVDVLNNTLRYKVCTLITRKDKEHMAKLIADFRSDLPSKIFDTVVTRVSADPLGSI